MRRLQMTDRSMSWRCIVAVLLWAWHSSGATVSDLPVNRFREKVSVSAINQRGTGRIVLFDNVAAMLQRLADRQDGSLVHRYTQEEVDQRLVAHAEAFPGFVNSTLIVREDERATRSVHASTIAEVAPGIMLASWFGGTWERMGDVGIWLARYEHGKWGPPRQVAWPKPDNTYKGWMAPCWNPVLLHASHLGTTFLFYKVGVNTQVWRGYILRSYDGGLTWDKPEAMEPGLIGAVKNPPIILEDGTIVSPSSTEDRDWVSHVEISRDNGTTWEKHADIRFGKGVIQPTIFRTLDGKLRMAMRPHHDKKVILTDSSDEGESWHRPKASKLGSPNSGLCAVGLPDGRIVIVHNTEDRSTLRISVSNNKGATFETAAVLEHDPEKYNRPIECHQVGFPPEAEAEGPEYSYPTIVQSPSSGLLHITYTFTYYGSGARCTGRENIKHVVVDPCRLGDPSKAPHNVC